MSKDGIQDPSNQPPKGSKILTRVMSFVIRDTPASPPTATAVPAPAAAIKSVSNEEQKKDKKEKKSKDKKEKNEKSEKSSRIKRLSMQLLPSLFGEETETKTPLSAGREKTNSEADREVYLRMAREKKYPVTLFREGELEKLRQADRAEIERISQHNPSRPALTPLQALFEAGNTQETVSSNKRGSVIYAVPPTAAPIAHNRGSVVYHTPPAELGRTDSMKLLNASVRALTIQEQDNAVLKPKP